MDFATRLLRQRVLSTVAKYLAEHLKGCSAVEVGRLARAGADLVPAIKQDLSRKLGEEGLNALVAEARRHTACFSAADVPIIQERLARLLPAPHRAALRHHHKWLGRQLLGVWQQLNSSQGV